MNWFIWVYDKIEELDTGKQILAWSLIVFLGFSVFCMISSILIWLQDWIVDQINTRRLIRIQNLIHDHIKHRNGIIITTAEINQFSKKCIIDSLEANLKSNINRSYIFIGVDNKIILELFEIQLDNASIYKRVTTKICRYPKNHVYDSKYETSYPVLAYIPNEWGFKENETE